MEEGDDDVDADRPTAVRETPGAVARCDVGGAGVVRLVVLPAPAGVVAVEAAGREVLGPREGGPPTVAVGGA
ncbi:MAG: hypothetical protein J2P58_13505, partial [Acidimicrobiaceae bacterium]|nr:hypothetical protein [Acidimicrobiaceae bacterium]